MTPLFITWNPDPILLDLGFISLRWYSLLFAAGMGLGYFFTYKRWKKLGHSREFTDQLFLYIILGTVLGARIGHCLFYDWAYFSEHPLEILLPVKFEPEFRFTGFLGLASHGGAIGVLLAMYIFSRKQKISLLWIFDQMALAIPLATGFIRMGNLMNSEILGKVTDGWGFWFKLVDKTETVRHPAQLYEALSYFSIFILLNLLYKKRKEVLADGFIFGLFLTLMFLARFLIEFLKENQVDFEAGMTINMGQSLSIPFILGGLLLMFFYRKKKEI